MDEWLKNMITMPVADLRLSGEFKAMMAAQGFATLDDLMSLPLRELVSENWFTKKMVEELAEFMFNAKKSSGT